MTALEARNVTFAYPSSRPILKSWSHSFVTGHMYGLTGASGRGKSTLLYMLGLMLKPSEGSICVGGNCVSGASDAVRARLRAHRFGFVFQDSALDPRRTVLDNVTETALYRGERRVEMRAAALTLLEQFGVAMRPEAKPTQISGGQAQRIALCRALAHQPDIILADEPTGNLDRDSRDIVISALGSYAHNGATVIIVSHDSHVADACDEVIGL